MAIEDDFPMPDEKPEVVRSFVCLDRSRWFLTRNMLRQLQEEYARPPEFTAEDVEREVQAAGDWLDEQPAFRRSPGGMGRFLHQWLSNVRTAKPQS